MWAALPHQPRHFRAGLRHRLGPHFHPEGHKVIDVFHITKGPAKLTDAEQLALKADLEEMLGD
jgi:hypothetical protein